MSDYTGYFNLRNVDSTYYSKYKIPNYIKRVLPPDKNTAILDIGCGFGSFIRELKSQGYSSVKGIDISDEAIKYSLEQNYDVKKASITEYSEQSKNKYDLIMMSHVLEHIRKEEIINTLTLIKSRLLSPKGKLCLMVPNAQSNTDSYWAYEDFTHATLFTSGSLLYVLKAAGFSKIQFLDKNGTENSNLLLKFIKIIFLPIYRFNKFFWNKVTSSSFHEQSPNIYTFELKILAE